MAVECLEKLLGRDRMELGEAVPLVGMERLVGRPAFCKLDMIYYTN